MVSTKRRDYEVSIWTLQDEFITVLKRTKIENKGQIITPKMRLNTDGTQEFTFSIPMYIYRDGVRQENPIWYNTKNGNIIINMRKIKVIFNKMTDAEKIYDFLITKVVERHEKDELYCDITCEGLAFHELGKVGYKISFSPDDFYDEDYKIFEEYYNSTDTEPGSGQEPQQLKATLQYWLNKFLTPLPNDNTPIKANVWYYKVQMDWSSYAYGSKRDTEKVYEEPYTASWETADGKLIPSVVENFREKERLIEKEESNIYNLTQEIAKSFGIFCRYEYGYDDNYHIISRKIIFYNNFIQEQDGYISLTYPYSTNKVSREIDSTETVTKLFVKPAETENSDQEEITIMNVEANKCLEDYILNFDYLHKNGAITEEQWAAIAEYETNVHDCNAAIIPTTEQLISLRNELPELEAKLTIAENALQLDQERISNANNVLNNLDLKDYSEDGSITVTEANPRSAVLQPDTSYTKGNMYYIKISEQGVLPETVRIFKTLNFSSSTSRLTREIYGDTFEYDEFGNLTQINNVYTVLDNNDSKIAYLTYKYVPRMYYENIKRTWESRLRKDAQDREDLIQEIDAIKQSIENKQTHYEELLEQKQKYLADFEHMMGPALREGYWQPEDYDDYGNRYTDFIQGFPSSADAKPIKGDSGYTFSIWDDNKFDGEQTLTYTLGVDEQEKTYPCICLNGHLAAIKDHLHELSLLYYDYIHTTVEPHEPRKMRAMALGSLCQLGFCTQSSSSNSAIMPVLILTGAEKMTEEELRSLQDLSRSEACLGKLVTVVEGEHPNVTVETTIEKYVTLTEYDWFIPEKIYYPRIKVDSLGLKIDDNQLALSYGENFLTNYEDYSVLFRDDSYYVTPRPEALLRNGSLGALLAFKFAISNADISIYLDALQVMKENSHPKVSYEVAPSSINTDFVYDDYNKLARIVNINDHDLKFEDVQGYISELELDLEKPYDDVITIKNYKTKFEDLFSTIVAQTEAMQKNEYNIGLAASIFAQPGQIAPELIQNSIARADLEYAFNNGNLTIDEVNGIWGTSDSGVVAFRGGGIFTATAKDSNDNWIWNTGILPSGINANLITTGQLDTNLIRIFAGDKLRFQMNGDGLFAYKSALNDEKIISAANEYNSFILNHQLTNEVDSKQYVVYNDEGLFLRADEGACVPTKRYLWLKFSAQDDRSDSTPRPKGKTHIGVAISDAMIEPATYDWRELPSNASEAPFSYPEHNKDGHTYSMYIVFSGNESGDPFSFSPPDDTDDIYIGIRHGASTAGTTSSDYQFSPATDAGNYPYYEVQTIENPVTRVEISWDGLKLRNWENEDVFYADPDTGNLTVAGTIYATSLFIGDRNNPTTVDNYINNRLISGTALGIDTESGQIDIRAASEMNIGTNGDLTIHGGRVDIAADSKLNFTVNVETETKIGDGDTTSFILSHDFSSILEVKINDSALSSSEYQYNSSTRELTFTTKPANQSNILITGNTGSSIIITPTGVNINAESEFKVDSGGFVQIEACTLLEHPQDSSNYIRFSKQITVDGQSDTQTTLNINDLGITALQGDFSDSLIFNGATVITTKWVNMPIIINSGAPTTALIEPNIPFLHIDISQQGAVNPIERNIWKLGNGTDANYIYTTESDAIANGGLLSVPLNDGTADYHINSNGTQDRFKYHAEIRVWGRQAGGGRNDAVITATFQLSRRKTGSEYTVANTDKVEMYTSASVPYQAHPESSYTTLIFETTSSINLLDTRQNGYTDDLYGALWIQGPNIYKPSSDPNNIYNTHPGLNVLLTGTNQFPYFLQCICTPSRADTPRTITQATFYPIGIAPQS